ncbi:PXA domain protein 1 [Colletotrichum fructicola]|nr:PXA domain protein 1 [Colletotrichum fructicola]KAF4905117.1 PXA domain protein 1 [Colletotrichum fructicola]KAF4929020.1 PXA domain protein 1 [Colletotrichum fructicola]
MTAVATPRAPTPRPKAPATVSFANDITSFAPTPSTPATERLRPQLQSNPSARRSIRAAPADFLSDRATAAFIRRVLCSQQLSDKERTTPPPIEELLPPLTSRNDVDLQLYALIAVILREYVQAWYSKITPDEAFVDEIVQIIAHCTRALEQRLRKVDLESLLFDELPDLLDKHIVAYRAAHDPVLAPLSPIPRPDQPETVAKQQENEAIYRQLLVQGVLAVLLPTEDLENDCLTSLVGQIFSELIIGNVLANRLSQPWLIYECLIILTRVLERKSEPIEEDVAEAVQAGSAAPLPRPARCSWSIQGVFWSFVHWCFLSFAMIRLLVSTLAMSSSLPPRADVAYDEKHELTGQLSDSKTPDALTGLDEAQPVKTPIFAFKLWTCISDLIELDARMPWLSGTLSMLQLGAMKGPGRVAALNGPMDRKPHLRAQLQQRAPTYKGLVTTVISFIHAHLRRPGTQSLNRHALRFPSPHRIRLPETPSEVGTRVGIILAAGDRAAFTSSIIMGLPTGFVNGRLLISHTIHQRVLDAAYLPTLLRSIRAALFPNNAPGVSTLVAPSSDQELRALRRRCASAVLARIPPWLARLYLGGRGLGLRWRSGPDSRATGAAAEAGASGDDTAAAGGAGSAPGSSRDANVEAVATGTSDCDSSGDENGTKSQPPEDDEDQQQMLSEIEEGILDVFSDEYCNKHFVYGMLELILVRLMPELAEKGVVELWEERLSL